MEHILLERSHDGRIATLTMNRPKVRNAFNSHTIAEFQQLLREMGSDTKLRCVVITGSGSAFCGGADINWMRASRDFTLDENRRDAATMAAMFHNLARLPKVTLAKVNGPCFGGGVGLVATCDIAIAATRARFAFSEVKLGIIPAVISPHVMAKLGYGRTLNLFLKGNVFSAEEALEYGLVHQVVEADKLDAAVEAELDQLRSSAPQACAETKALLRRLPWTPYETVDALTVGVISRLRSGIEGQEGLAAFCQKRQPAWARPSEPEAPAEA